MKTKKLQLMFAGLILCAAAVIAVAQEKSKEEMKLETSSGELDKSAVMPEGQLRVTEKIKTEYGLARSLPGGITDANVQKIMALRQGPPVMGWGKIAGDLGLKLGKVQSNVHKMAAAVHKMEKIQAKKDKKAEIEKGRKGDKMDKPMKAEKPERPGNSGKR